MLLALAVGNTTINVGLFREGSEEFADEPVNVARLSTGRPYTPDELAIYLKNVLGADADSVTGIAVASVVPRLTGVIDEMVGEYWPDSSLLVLGPGVRTGMKLRTDNPREIGADRVAAAVAAWNRYGEASDGCVVVGVGTVIRIDVISPRGEFLGGALAPGMDISVAALAEHTSSLRAVEVLAPRSAIGSDTVSALQSGIVFGSAALIDGLIARMRREYPRLEGCDVIATGTHASVLLDYSHEISRYEPNLDLVGLRDIYLLNDR